MNQLSLDFAPHNGTATSKAGASDVAPRLSKQKALVLDMVRNREEYGATREEIATELGIKESSVCGRVSELKEAGKLTEPGNTRVGSQGSKQSVLIATEGPTR